jgi:hypothetical protein
MFASVKPDHLFDALVEEVHRTGTAPTDDPIRNAVGEMLLGNTSAPEEVVYAFSIYHHPYKREVLEAFLITGADAEHVNAVLAIPIPVVEIYTSVFFDLESFRDRLDLEVYVREYPSDHDDGFGHELKTDALENGRHWISAKFGREHYQVPSAAALKETINQAYIHSKRAINASLDSVESKEARQWSGTLMGSIRILPDIEDAEAGARDALKIELITIRRRARGVEIPPEDIVTVTDETE